MKNLKIAVSGAHSTGKSTFLAEIAKHIQSKGFRYSLVSDLAIRCPLPILREHTVESTLWIVATGIAEEIAATHKSSIVFVDRPVLDAWAYLMAIFPERSDAKLTPQFRTLENVIRNWLPTYTLLYQTRIDDSIPIEDNKGRDLDSVYRLQVGEQMELACQMFEVWPRILDAANLSQEIDWLVNYLETNA